MTLKSRYYYSVFLGQNPRLGEVKNGLSMTQIVSGKIGIQLFPYYCFTNLIIEFSLAYEGVIIIPSR